MEIKPQVVQVEVHPYFLQNKLKNVRYYTATPEMIVAYAAMELKEDL